MWLGIAAAVGTVAVVASAIGLPGGPSPAASPLVVGRSPLLDRPAPTFQLARLDGGSVRLEDYRGRPVIVNFWASWCEPCKAEFQLFRAARKSHIAERLEILGVVYNDSPDAARRFFAAQKGEWPALADPGGAVARAYGVLALPITYYVDREGVVRWVSYGPPPPDAFEEQLRRIL